MALAQKAHVTSTKVQHKAASTAQLKWGPSQTPHTVHYLGLLQIQQEYFLFAFQLHMTTDSNKYATGMM